MGVKLPAFQTLVDAHWRDVARLAHALAGPVDGDDVAQQAWTQALAAYPSLRSAPISARSTRRSADASAAPTAAATARPPLAPPRSVTSSDPAPPGIRSAAETLPGARALILRWAA